MSVPHIRHELTWKYWVKNYVSPLLGHDQFFFYRRSLPQALCWASLCSLKVLACVEVSLSLPSVPLNGSAPTLTLQHFKGRPKGRWANMDMRRRPCNKAGGGKGRGYQCLICSQQEKVHCHSLPEVKSSLMIHVFLAVIIGLVLVKYLVPCLFLSFFWQDFYAAVSHMRCLENICWWQTKMLLNKC